MSNVSGIAVLPAVNRNLPCVISQSTSGIIAYGSRNNIFLIDFRNNPPVVLDSKFIQEAHRGKIVSVSFCKCDNVDLLASIGDDCKLKVWDLETLTCFLTLEVRESTHHVAWIYGSASTLLFPSDPKSISKLNITSGNISKIKTGSEMLVTAFECNEKLPEFVAIGHANGLISIVNVTQEKLLHVLRIHSMEVTDLSWSPISPDTLLSVSLDLTLRVWKMEGYKLIWAYYFPPSRQKDDKRKVRPLGVFHPKKPDVIICTTPRGEMGEITFMEDEKPKFSHYSCSNFEFLKFPISLSIFPTDSDKQEGNLLCCDAYKVSIVDINKQKIVSQIPFLMGFVYDLTNSAVNPNLLAISNGDGILKIWNTRAEGALVDIFSIYVYYKTKIMTAAWHPTDENILAYGTDEGRVGIVDIYKRRVVNSFETHHSDAVYSITWGPCEKAPNKSGENGAFYLYSCGSGIVYIHKLFEFKAKALNFEDLAEWPPDVETTERVWSEISWKSDYSCVCLGSYRGFIDIFNEKFVFLARFNIHMKTVESVRWHPENTYMSPSGSPMKFWLASCGNDQDIHIIDTSKIFDEGEKNAPREALKKLVGHKKRVVSLCWSQHNDGFLVSASKDCTAVVWNVSTGTIIATYMNHKDFVFGVQWSLFDKDIIYSGGQDSCVRMWKISEQSVSEIPDKVKPRKKLKKPKKFPSTSSVHESSTEINSELPVGNDSNEKKITHEEENTEADISLPEDKNSGAASNQSNKEKKTSNEFSPEDAGSTSIKWVKDSQQCAKNSYMLFPENALSRIGTIQDVNDCERLADILSEKTCSPPGVIQHINLSKSERISDDDAVKFGPFTDQATALRMLQVKSEILKPKDFYSSVQLGVMAADIKPMLQNAAQNNNLSCYLVSLAPSVSYNFWLEMCEKFARQLVGERLHYCASNYFLMCGKIYDAINTLAQRNIVDALVLAKAHLPALDPVISELLFKVKKTYAFRGNKVGEAKCNMALNEPLIAAKVLCSCPDANHARGAAYICRKFNLDQEAEDYAFICLERILQSCNWSSFQLLVNQEPKMQVYGALVAIHEALHVQVQSLKNKHGIIVKYIFPLYDPTDEVKIWCGNTCTDAKVSFIEHVYHHLLPMKQSDLREMLEMLKALPGKQRIFSSNALVSVAIHITEFIILCHLEESILASQVFLKTFEAAHNNASHKNNLLLKIVCFLLLPMGLCWSKDTSSFNCKTIVCENVENDVHVYKTICKGLIDKINSFKYQSIKSVTIIKEELLLDVQYVTDRICNILSTKNIEDYVLSYFSSSILDNLVKSIIKNIQKMKCLADSNGSTALSKTNVSEIALQNDFVDKNSVDKSLSSANGSTTFSETEVSEIALQNDFVDKNSVDKSLSSANGSTTFSETEVSKIALQNDFVDKNSVDKSLSSANESTTFSTTEVPEIAPQNDFEDKKEDIRGTSNREETVECETSQVVESDVLSQEMIELALKKLHVSEIALQKDFEDKKEDIRGTSNREETVECETSQVVESDVLLQEMIELALKEAEEKAASFTEYNSISEPKVNLIPSKTSEKVFSDFAEITKAINDIDEDTLEPLNLHTQCLKSIEIFYNVVSFVTLNICKDEHALLYYLKRRVDSINAENAAKVLSKFSKENKMELKGRQLLVNAKTALNCDKEMQDNFKGVNSELPESEETGKTDQDPSENAPNELVDSDFAVVKSNLDIENSVENLELSTSNQSMKNACEITRSHQSTLNSHEDSDALQEDKNEVPKESFHLMNNTEDSINAELVTTENEFMDENLSSELTELKELISRLEKETQICYPDPFDAIPKILQIIYIVKQNSECSVVQDKLHELIHEVISWFNKFFYEELELACLSCSK